MYNFNFTGGKPNKKTFVLSCVLVLCVCCGLCVCVSHFYVCLGGCHISYYERVYNLLVKVYPVNVNIW